MGIATLTLRRQAAIATAKARVIESVAQNPEGPDVDPAIVEDFEEAQAVLDRAEAILAKYPDASEAKKAAKEALVERNRCEEILRKARAQVAAAKADAEAVRLRTRHSRAQVDARRRPDARAQGPRRQVARTILAYGAVSPPKARSHRAGLGRLRLRRRACSFQVRRRCRRSLTSRFAMRDERDGFCWRCWHTYTGLQACDGCQFVLRLCWCRAVVREALRSRRHGWLCQKCFAAQHGSAAA
jgi:hypothetical protein